MKNIAYIGVQVGCSGLALAQAPAATVLLERDFLAVIERHRGVARTAEQFKATNIRIPAKLQYFCQRASRPVIGCAN